MENEDGDQGSEVVEEATTGDGPKVKIEVKPKSANKTPYSSRPGTPVRPMSAMDIQMPPVFEFRRPVSAKTPSRLNITREEHTNILATPVVKPRLSEVYIVFRTPAVAITPRIEELARPSLRYVRALLYEMEEILSPKIVERLRRLLNEDFTSIYQEASGDLRERSITAGRGSRTTGGRRSPARPGSAGRTGGGGRSPSGRPPSGGRPASGGRPPSGGRPGSAGSDGSGRKQGDLKGYGQSGGSETQFRNKREEWTHTLALKIAEKLSGYVDMVDEELAPTLRRESLEKCLKQKLEAKFKDSMGAQSEVTERLLDLLAKELAVWMEKVMQDLENGGDGDISLTDIAALARLGSLQPVGEEGEEGVEGQTAEEGGAPEAEDTAAEDGEAEAGGEAGESPGEGQEPGEEAAGEEGEEGGEEGGATGGDGGDEPPSGEDELEAGEGAVGEEVEEEIGEEEEGEAGEAEPGEEEAPEDSGEMGEPAEGEEGAEEEGESETEGMEGTEGDLGVVGITGLPHLKLTADMTPSAVVAVIIRDLANMLEERYGVEVGSESEESVKLVSFRQQEIKAFLMENAQNYITSLSADGSPPWVMRAVEAAMEHLAEWMESVVGVAEKRAEEREKNAPPAERPMTREETGQWVGRLEDGVNKALCWVNWLKEAVDAAELRGMQCMRRKIPFTQHVPKETTWRCCRETVDPRFEKGSWRREVTNRGMQFIEMKKCFTEETEQWKIQIASATVLGDQRPRFSSNNGGGD